MTASTLGRLFNEVAEPPRISCGAPSWAYGGDIGSLDLITGMNAEDRPEGFAFGDTAFRIIILMASRRLNSDRFFTKDFTERVYTREEIRWIKDNTMASVLRRHCPALASFSTSIIDKPVAGADAMVNEKLYFRLTG